jgi:hypothetical protein
VQRIERELERGASRPRNKSQLKTFWIYCIFAPTGEQQVISSIVISSAYKGMCNANPHVDVKGMVAE